MKDNKSYSPQKHWLWDMARLTILVSLFYTEYFISKSLFGSLVIWHWVAFAACILVGTTLFVLGLCSKEGKLNCFTKPQRDLITNFFDNTIGGGFIAIVLLVWFLTHLQFTYTSALGLVMSDLYEGSAWKHLCMIFANILSIYLSLFLYPRYPDVKPAEDRQYIISGLSLNRNGKVSSRNVDLILKPFTSANLDNIKRMVIIPSKPIEELSVDDDIFNYNEKSFDFKKVALAFLEQSTLANIEIVKKRVNECEFIIESHTDYDEFAQCVETIDRTMKKYEKDKSLKMRPDDTLLYISPGTGAIGAALTAFSIPGARLIAYWTQLKNDNVMNFFDVRVSGLDRIYAEISESCSNLSN